MMVWCIACALVRRIEQNEILKSTMTISNLNSTIIEVSQQTTIVSYAEGLCIIGGED